MLEALRNRVIAFGFEGWVLWVRVLRFLRNLGRPRLGTLDHVTIPVHNLDEAERFYCGVLGGAFLMKVDNELFRRYGRPEMDPEGAFHISVLFGGATRVDLFLQSHGQAAGTAGHPHYAFRIPPRDFAKWQARLAEAGVPMDGPLQLGPPGQASLYFNDPFGNHLELTCLGYAKPIPIRAPQMTKIIWPGRSLAAE
jgi:catechol 2,3-dioxygenase-like lactoylglutathione lyase family enzyme